MARLFYRAADIFTALKHALKFLVDKKIELYIVKAVANDAVMIQAATGWDG